MRVLVRFFDGPESQREVFLPLQEAALAIAMAVNLGERVSLGSETIDENYNKNKLTRDMRQQIGDMVKSVSM